ENGNVLNIVLNKTGGENVSVVTSFDLPSLPGNYTLVLNNGDTWSGNNDNNRVTGSGSATLTVTPLVFTGGINISDSAAGQSVSFDNSDGHSYGDPITVQLSEAAAGSITFNGSNFFGGGLTAVTTSSITVSSGARLDTDGGLALTAASNLTVASN